MEFTAGTIADIIIVIFCLEEIIRGWSVGFALKLINVLVIVASFVIALVVARALQHMWLIGPVFLVLAILLSRLSRLVNFVNRIPVIRGLNRFGGAVVGLVVAVLICFVVLNFFYAIIPERTLANWGFTSEAIEGTFLMKRFL